MLTAGGIMQLGLSRQSLYIHVSWPWPSKVPLPMRFKPVMDSNRIHTGDEYSVISVVAKTVPWISTVIGASHGPAYTNGPVRNFPGGKTTFAGPPEWHASTHAFMNACMFPCHNVCINIKLDLNCMKLWLGTTTVHNDMILSSLSEFSWWYDIV